MRSRGAAATAIDLTAYRFSPLSAFTGVPRVSLTERFRQKIWGS